MNHSSSTKILTAVAAAVASVSLFASPAAQAASGTWTNTASGKLWGTSTNWSGGTIADGSDFTASFNTLDITSSNTVHLDSARTIGNLVFGDTTPNVNWTLDNNGVAANILTLAVTAGTPTVTVDNQTATISTAIAGSQGLAKAGDGILVLSGTNTFTGGLTINGGQLNFSKDANLGAANESVTLNGAILKSDNSAASTFGTGRALILGTNGGTISANGYSPHVYAFNISGSGPLTLNGTTNQITLSGSNTNTGGFVINSGRVRFDNATALPTVGSITISNGGLVAAGAISSVQGWLDSGRIDTSSTGAILLASSTSGNIDMTGYDSLILGAAVDATYTGTLTPSGTTYRLGGANLNATLTLSKLNALTGARDLVIGNGTSTGYGQVTLSNANNYSGGTSVTYGSRLSVSNSNALGSGAVAVTSGELRLITGVNVGNTLNLSGDPLSVPGLGKGAVRSSTGANELSGTINVVASASISTDNTAGNSLRISGDVNLGSNFLRFYAGDSSNSVGGDITVDGHFIGSGGIGKSNTGMLTLNVANADWSGSTSLGGGTLAIGDDLALGNGGTLGFGPSSGLTSVGIQSTNASAHTIANVLGTFSGPTAGAGSTYTFGATTGGTGNLTFSNTTSASLGGAVRTFQVHNTTEFDGGFSSGGGGITKTGDGVMIMKGASTYTGATKVNAGTFILGVDGVGSLTSAVTVNAGILGGSGSTTGNVVIGDGSASDAFMSPGNNSIGTFTTTGSLSMLSDATFTFELNSTTGIADSVAANGFSLDSNALFSFNDLGNGSGLTEGQEFVLFNNTSGSAINGTFFNLADGSTFFSNGIGYVASYTGGTGNDLVLTVAAVPEPGTWALLAGGFGMLMSGLRRRGQKSGIQC